jgi:hypothetical protein
MLKSSMAESFGMRLPHALALAIALVVCLPAAAQNKLREEEAVKIGVEAYVFGYPLVLTDVTRQVSTAVPKVLGQKAPVNQFAHLRQFPSLTFSDVVSSNADTLSSIAWLDLKREPMILSLPAVGKRYYMAPMLDAWTNVFAVLGTRATGNGKGDFAIVGPQWTGKLPAGIKEIKSPTAMVWLIGRTQTNGRRDYPAVHAIQDRYQLTPLSAWSKGYTPPSDVVIEPGTDTKLPPKAQVARMDAATFFGRLNALMQDNPPAAADAPALARFAAIGVAPGKPFDLKNMELAVARGLERSVRAGQAQIVTNTRRAQGTKVNGWDLFTKTGSYGTDYLWRAIVALTGLGANLPEDATYPRATVDADGQPLTGANRYMVRFAKGQLPPVNAFWSLTMYNAKQAFVQNPINRYAIGNRDKLKLDPDGSLTLHVHPDSPGKDKESNWLPAPKDSFNVVMRLYWPKQEILDGIWKIPPVERLKS